MSNDWIGLIGILAGLALLIVLAYRGWSVLLVGPAAAALFRRADIPHRLIPAAVALGAFTFTMTAMPGTPAIQNAIPMPYFGTTPFAAPGLGLIASAVILLFGLAWLGWVAGQARRRGEGIGIPVDGGWLAQ